jgi:hypothetical protein
MQLVILHYHLNRGGVARVVENQLLALAEAQVPLEQVLVLHGGRADGWPHERLARQLPFPLQTSAIPGLDYDSVNGDSVDVDSVDGDSVNGDSVDGDVVERATSLTGKIVDAVNQAGCVDSRTLLHWHNHALGKNGAVPLVVTALCRRGLRTLLQIHDFAEDLRPDNYQHLATALTAGQIDQLPEVLYPQSAAIHYAVLNGRDRQLLNNTGITGQRLHLLPNPVSSPSDPTIHKTSARQQLAKLLDMPIDATWITYPVRGIRRKNLGEMLLWSIAASVPATGPVWLHVTLKPQNPAEQTSFRRWQRLAEQLDLPCRFGSPANGQMSYKQVLSACDLLLTTSVAEGFGMVFLECWLAGKQLLGRDLPEITTDFRQAGIRLEPLTPELAIPAAWIDRERLVQTLEMLYHQLLAHYGQQPPATPTGASPFAPLLEKPTIDFARLPAPMQEGIIRHVHLNSKAQAQLRDLNRQLDLASDDSLGPRARERIDANRKVVEQNYSLTCIGRQLGAIYTRLLETEPSPHIHSLPRGNSLLESLLRADRLHPIRIEP